MLCFMKFFDVFFLKFVMICYLLKGNGDQVLHVHKVL